MSVEQWVTVIGAAVGALGTIAALVLKIFFPVKSSTEEEDKKRDEDRKEKEKAEKEGRTTWMVFFALVLLGASCTSFTYKHYILNLEDGKLQGPKPLDDLPINVCAHTTEGYHCIAMKIDDFYAMKEDYDKKTERLIILEKRCGESK